MYGLPTCVFLGLVALALSGCGVLGGNEDESGIDPKAFIPINARTEAPDLAALRAYNVPPGTCGMILFTKSGQRTVPVMRLLGNGSAVLEVENDLTNFTVIEQGGESRVGLPSYARLRGQLADGRVVLAETVAKWGQSFPAGAYVEAGTLTLRGEDGWSRVLPIAGIAGCKA